MENREIIFVAGLGATGSSAVVDLLKEVHSYFVFENEFRLFVDPGGLINLRDAIVDNWSLFQADFAIKNYKKMVKAINNRFRSPYSTLGHNKYLDNELIKQTNRYINNLTEVKYAGLWYGIDNLISRQLNKLKWFTRKKIISKNIYVAKQFSEDEFNNETYKYMKTLINYCLKKYKAKHFCFNENLSCMFPEKILKMVQGSKLLLVIREPRDVYATALKNKWPVAPLKSEDFLKWELAIFNRWMKIHERLVKKDPKEKKYKVLKFEELIKEYDRVVPEIFQFCGVDVEDHIEKKKYLNPQISIKNVGLWENVLGEEESDKIYNSFKHFYERYDYTH